MNRQGNLNSVQCLVKSEDELLGRDPADDIKSRLDADQVPDFSPKPIVKVDVLQIVKLIVGFLRRWI